MALIVKSVVRDSMSSGPPISLSVRRLPEVSIETVPVMAEIVAAAIPCRHLQRRRAGDFERPAEVRQPDIARDRAHMRLAARGGGVEAGHVFDRQQPDVREHGQLEPLRYPQRDGHLCHERLLTDAAVVPGVGDDHRVPFRRIKSQARPVRCRLDLRLLEAAGDDSDLHGDVRAIAARDRQVARTEQVQAQFLDARGHREGLLRIGRRRFARPLHAAAHPLKDAAHAQVRTPAAPAAP